MNKNAILNQECVNLIQQTTQSMNEILKQSNETASRMEKDLLSLDSLMSKIKKNTILNNQRMEWIHRKQWLIDN